MKTGEKWFLGFIGLMAVAIITLYIIEQNYASDREEEYDNMKRILEIDEAAGDQLVICPEGSTGDKYQAYRPSKNQRYVCGIDLFNSTNIE